MSAYARKDVASSQETFDYVIVHASAPDTLGTLRVPAL